MNPPLPQDDLDFALSGTGDIWRRFAGTRLLITGGTGFVGTWLVELILRANTVLNSQIDLIVVTRDMARAQAHLPHVFARGDTSAVVADIRQLDRDIGAVDLCIHAAADVRVRAGAADAVTSFDSIVGGTRHLLEIARSNGASRFLLTSSGAVYGTQPTDLDRIPETYSGAPDLLDPQAAYGNGKRAAEWLTTAMAREGFGSAIARIFAVIGPGLPLDGSFAAGNFIRDGLAGRPIEIRGDGRTVRSYLYTADLCIWLLRILTDGQSGAAYNVGSEHPTTIAALASEIAGRTEMPVSGGQLSVDGLTGAVPRYVPCTAKARAELHLVESYTLGALDKTIAWTRQLRAASYP